MVGFRSDRDGRNSRGGFGDRDRFNDRNDRRGGGFRGRRDSERRPLEMHTVICDKCKKECEVPFKPTSNKPVYCSDCFKSEGGDSRSKNNSPGVSSDQFNQINTKLDKIISLLELLEVEVDEDSEEEEK